jgi:hypothetical protein
LAKKPNSEGVDYIDYILNHRLNAATRRDAYLVKWSGAPLSDALWVDFADIHDYSAITQFLASRDRIPKSNRKTREKNIAQAIANGSQETEFKAELEITDSKSASTEIVDRTSSTAKRHTTIPIILLNQNIKTTQNITTTQVTQPVVPIITRPGPIISLPQVGPIVKLPQPVRKPASIPTVTNVLLPIAASTASSIHGRKLTKAKIPQGKRF